MPAPLAIDQATEAAVPKRRWEGSVSPVMVPINDFRLRPDHHRPPEGRQIGLMLEKLKVMGHLLAETDAGIDENSIDFDPSRGCGGDAAL